MRCLMKYRLWNVLACLVILNEMLTEITRASTAMQSADISLDTAVLLIDNLKNYFPSTERMGLKRL